MRQSFRTSLQDVLIFVHPVTTLGGVPTSGVEVRHRMICGLLAPPALATKITLPEGYSDVLNAWIKLSKVVMV